MNQRTDRLANLRIASPCSVGWENMEGNDRIRFCRECGLNVYNLSEMTRRQVESLIAHSEGRICARLYRRSDGTVLTRDCPVGLRAVRRRISRVAGATLTAIMSLFGISAAFGQEKKSCPTGLKIQRTTQDGELSTIWGTVMDQNGAVIVDAKVTLINEGMKRTTTFTSTSEGKFTFLLLAPGKYTLTVESPGFMAYRNSLMINSHETLTAGVVLSVGAVGGIILITEPEVHVQSDGGTIVTSGDYLRKLP